MCRSAFSSANVHSLPTTMPSCRLRSLRFDKATRDRRPAGGPIAPVLDDRPLGAGSGALRRERRLVASVAFILAAAAIALEIAYAIGQFALATVEQFPS